MLESVGSNLLNLNKKTKNYLKESKKFYKEKAKENEQYYKEQLKQHTESFQKKYEENKQYYSDQIRENTQYYTEQFYENKEYYQKEAKEKISDISAGISESIKYPTLRRLITEKLGYPLEKHKYTTDDGYINTVFRIPGTKG